VVCARSRCRSGDGGGGDEFTPTAKGIDGCDMPGTLWSRIGGGRWVGGGVVTVRYSRCIVYQNPGRRAGL